MVEIKAFKGLRYNKEKIKDFSLVITPPYDVINKQEQEEFYALSEYNMVRLILGKEQEGDNGNNKYTRAAACLKDWHEKGVLKKDDKDSIYIYSQTFNNKTRIGFISLIKLEELGKGVLPHEKTLERPLADRFELLKTTKANLGCVFMLYDDKKKIIDSLIQENIENKKPAIEFEDKQKTNHKLWDISDEGFTNKLKEEMKQYQCIIADGHHRYKSVLKFKEENPGLKDVQYTMTYFVNSFNEGLFIHPIDRFIFNLNNVDINDILKQLSQYFEIEEMANVKKLVKKVDETTILVSKENNIKNHVFGMYCYLNKKSYFLKLKNDDILEKYYPKNTDIYKKLDVNILHKLIFEDIFKISEEQQSKGTNIEYTTGNVRALHKINQNKYQFAFFINAPLMREIFLTARANETMPQKSTYFYPKAYSGLVINKIDK